MDKKLILDFDRQQKSLKKQKRHKEPDKSAQSSHPGSKSKLSKKAKVEDDETFQPSTSYRDRARERREGLNKDFELDPDDLKISNPVAGGNLVDDDEQIDEAEKRRQQIEESKYLGGDVEHTHLVKGLDFALLEKVKNDQKLAEKLASHVGEEHDLLFGGEHSDSDEEEFKKEALLAASISTNSKRQLVDIEKLRKGKSTEIIPCRTAIARRILNVLDEKWPNKSELFLPGRMSYVIPIDDDAEDQSVTTYLLSREDTSKQDDSEVLNESDLALEQLINILARIRQGKTNVNSKSHKKIRDLDSVHNDYEY